jgi:hypothetical protein
MECDECHHQWIQRTAELPKRCPSRKCNSRLWNEDARQMVVTAPPVVKVETHPVRAVSTPREVVAIQIEQQPMCTYTEYDTETGETYGCNLPPGHKSKHRRGAMI